MCLATFHRLLILFDLQIVSTMWLLQFLFVVGDAGGFLEVVGSQVRTPRVSVCCVDHYLLHTTSWALISCGAYRVLMIICSFNNGCTL